MIGASIRHYNLIRELGSGGMGTVYLAEDTKLKRNVALKFLSPKVSADDETMERFQREAQAAAALNHPSIVTIYEIGEADGQKYIAMEYVEGETLRTKISAGQMPVDEVVRIAKQVCTGLGKAHEKGIVHRDIKPENILITKEGEAKILDFGIAKLRGAANLTKESMTVGTTRYMSPEQIKGEGVDPRSDIWSMGVVMYELLTCASPFKGDYDSALMYAILSEKPEPITHHRKDVPQGLERLIMKALEKEKRHRPREMAEMIASCSDLELAPGEESTVTMVARSGRPKAWIWAPGAIAVLLAFVLFLLLRPATPPPPNVAALKKVTFVGDVEQYDFSPDGSYAVYVSGTSGSHPKLTVQDLAGGSTIDLLSARLLGQPSWSPDGSLIAIGAVIDDSTTGVFLVPRLGGSPRRLLPFPMRILAWSPDGRQIAMSAGAKRILFASVVSGDTVSRDLTGKLGEVLSIDWSPDGEVLLIHSRGDRYSSIWKMAVREGDLEALYHETFSRNTLLLSPRWSPDGDALYFIREDLSTRADELMKLPLGADKNPAGDPFPTAVNFRNIQSFDLTRDGKMLSLKGNTSANLWLLKKDGSRVSHHELTRGTARRSRATLAPTGDALVFAMMDAEGFNIYTMQLEWKDEGIVGRSPRKLTSLGSVNFSPVWSPDGREIAFLSTEGGRAQVWKVGAGGEALRRFDATAVHPDARGLVWAPGAGVIYAGPESRLLYLLNTSSGESQPLLEDSSLDFMDAAVWGPDGETAAARLFYGWNDPRTGIWLISEGHVVKQLTAAWDFVPIGWSSSADVLFALKSGVPEVYTVSVRSGRVRPYLALPFEKVDGKMLTVSGDGSLFLYTLQEERRDLWIVENYDPQMH